MTWEEAAFSLSLSHTGGRLSSLFKSAGVFETTTTTIMTPTTPTPTGGGGARRDYGALVNASSSGSQRRGVQSFGKGVGEDDDCDDEMLKPMEGTRGGFGWRQGGGGGGGRRRTALFAGACVAASLLAVSTGRGMRDSLQTTRTTRGVLGSSSASQFLDDARDVSKTNLVLCKIPKIGGTTLAGVGRRIGESHGLSGTRSGDWITNEPGVWMDHMAMQDGLSEKINNLSKEKFVFTLVRSPVDRMISNFQYTFMDPKHSESRVNLCHDNTGNPACRLPLPQTRNEIEERLIEYVEHANINIERDYCMPQAGINEQWSVQRMMDNLDFVGITERFDENLIVLKEIFNLEYSDILYLSANVIEYNWGGTASGAEATIGASEDGEESKVNGAASLGEDTLSADVQTKVENLMHGSADFQLWDLANEKLDAIVSQIPNFENKLKTFTAFREAAQDHCKAYADGTGDASQCLYADEGCGEQCLNEFSKNENNLLSALTMAQSTEMLAAPNVENLRSIVDFGDKKK